MDVTGLSGRAGSRFNWVLVVASPTAGNSMRADHLLPGQKGLSPTPSWSMGSWADVQAGRSVVWPGLLQADFKGG